MNAETAVLYARVSSQSQHDEGYSIETQLEACRKYATTKGFLVIDELVDAQSGSTLSRPNFDKLKTSDADHVIVLTQDRLSRADELDTLNLVRDFEAAGKDVHSVDFGVMKSGDWEGLELYLRAKIAHDEREKIRERTMRGRLAAIRDGKIMFTGTTKYGYDYDAEAQNLIVNETEARVVLDVFQWCVDERIGFEAIARRLTDKAIPTRNDRGTTKHRKRQPETCWNQSTVAKILHSEIYIGRWHYRQYETKTVDGKTRRELCGQIEVPVPTIVPLQLWEAAQRQIAVNNERSPRNVKQEYLMRGRLVCSECGYAFDSVYDARMKTAPTRYRCGGQYKKAAGHDKLCKGYIPTNVFDTEVWRLVSEALKDPDKMQASTKVIRARRAATTKPDRAYLKRLSVDLEGVDSSIRKLLPLYLEDKFTKDQLDEQQTILSKRRTQIVGKIAELEDRLSLARSEAIAEERLIAFCSEIRHKLDGLNFAQKRAIIERYDVRGVIQRAEDGFYLSLSGKIWLESGPGLWFRSAFNRNR